MIINEVNEFRDLILKCGLREKASGDLRELLDCVQFYSDMCGCNMEAKTAKYSECNQRYFNFLKNNLKSIKEQILQYEQEVVFNFQGAFVEHISR